ncbi:MAG: dTDP-4-dehydrorhamnose 3,5-epimerase family protein [Hyphomicrobiales bacterium]
MSTPQKLTFEPLAISGAFRIKTQRHDDERGSFERLHCQEEFVVAGITEPFVQANLSQNKGKGIVRGLHYLAAPFREGKFIRCLEGAIFDAFVDLRIGSPTFGKWHGEEISNENGIGLYMPACCAHGYMTLTERATAIYQVQTLFDAEADRAVRWDDPEIGIAWPDCPSPRLSGKDAAAPLLSEIHRGELLAFSSP